MIFILLYYILLYATLIYKLDSDTLYIEGLFGVKKIRIPIKDIEAYNKFRGKIKGVKLSGIGRNTFALGKAAVNKIGTTSMFVTSNENIIFLKTDEINYAISPCNFHEIFEEKLKRSKIKLMDWDYKFNKVINPYKDKNFLIPFIVVSIVIFVLTINPFILYLKGDLPLKMPLNFDAHFMVLEYGTGKQFAFSQMTYGYLIWLF